MEELAAERSDPALSSKVHGMELIHTCYRITDPDRSVAFYEALGLENRRELPIREEAMNYFLGVPGHQARARADSQLRGRRYDLGTGYGHIALSVDDLDWTLERLEARASSPSGGPTVREGGSRLCFVRDPDGIKMELIDA